MSQIPSIDAIPKDRLRNLKAILTDIDDTLTLHGRLPAIAYDALERLRAAGVLIIPITGRPAGWCDHIARMWPADAIVGENGAFWFRYLEGEKKMLRVYTQAAALRKENTGKLWRIADEVLKTFKGTAIASDQAYREIDVAIDFCEDVPPLPLPTAQAIAKTFEDHGATAKVSSIHVNAWFGSHDKLSTSLKMLAEEFGISGDEAVQLVAYCGDSPNDAPMFSHFPLAIGVANVVPFLNMMPAKPNYLTASEGGHGFAEFAAAVLEAKSV
jgi:HAD superfamily hydrolase (TIGR01484 family)